MTTSLMQLDNGQWQILVNGLVVATCDTDAQKLFICAALGFATQAPGVTNWTQPDLFEAFRAVIAEDAKASTECDCGDCDVCGHRTEPDDSMDGDFDSAMASAGMGTDEDYGCYGGNED